jgi:hypothetical protein
MSGYTPCPGCGSTDYDCDCGKASRAPAAGSVEAPATA